MNVSEGSAAVRVHDLTKTFGDLTAVDRLQLEVPKGQCLALLGPNGAGKTTTIEILEGLTRPDDGEVTILGRGWDRDADFIRRHIGVQLQETRFPDRLTVQEVLAVFGSFYTQSKPVDEVLKLVELVEKKDVWTVKLSGGQRQRVALGCALINEPSVLFLDEPTTGLDPQARRHVWDIVQSFKARGGSVLLTTHYMEEAERLADLVIIVDHGKKIAEGTPAELIDGLEAESIVEFSVRDSDSPPNAEELSALEGVREARTSDKGFILSVQDTGVAIPSLVRFLQERGDTFSDLRTHRPSLEDVFVSLTGRHLRDD